MSLPKPYYDDGNGIVIYNSDCREILPHLPKVDLVLTDPPYGLGEKWGGNFTGKNGHGKLWGECPDWDKSTIAQSLLEQCIEMGKYAIVWGGNYYVVAPSRAWLAWDKVQEFTGCDFELAWTNMPIPAKAFRMSRIDAHQNCAEGAKRHPTQKPLALFAWCIGLSGNAQTILDPFMGSGTTLRACKDLGRKCIGVEIEERYCAIAVERLRQGVLPL